VSIISGLNVLSILVLMLSYEEFDSSYSQGEIGKLKVSDQVFVSEVKDSERR
jgi:hypothetical protein